MFPGEPLGEYWAASTGVLGQFSEKGDRATRGDSGAEVAETGGAVGDRTGRRLGGRIPATSLPTGSIDASCP